MTEMNDKLMDTTEAAEMLGLRPQTLFNWRCQNRGPRYVRLAGRSVRYRLSDLTQFIDANIVETVHSE